METHKYERSQVATLLERLDEPPHSLIIITGPRQVGKTTIVQQMWGKHPRKVIYALADEPGPPTAPRLEEEETPIHAIGPAESIAPPIEGAEREWLLWVWEKARERARFDPAGAVLVIDEIQKLGNWSEAVKGLWDRDRLNGLPLHVVLLGSSSLLLQKGLTESLAGRFERIHVSPWSFIEMSQAFGLDVNQYLYYGGYPGAMRHAAGDRSRITESRWRAHILEAIVAPSISKDIIALDRVERPELLRRLFELVARHSGQILTLRGALKTLAEEGHPKTIARYLDLLQDAGLIASLRRYAPDAGRNIDSHSKVNVLDTGLMTVMSRRTFDDALNDSTFRGRLVETAVGAHLYNTSAPGIRLHYWRDRDRHEVDFVLEFGIRLVGYEVKTGPRPRPQLGLREFKRRFPKARTLVVGEGGIPLSEFLSVPAHEWLAVP